MRKYISSLIIGRYENSIDYKQRNTEGNRSIDIFNKEKDILNIPEKKEKFLKAAIALQKEGLIKIKWEDPDNIIDKIHFKLRDIDTFYNISGIKKKDLLIDETLRKIEAIMIDIKQPWIIEYLSSLKYELISKKKIPSVIQNKGDFLFDSLIGLDEVITGEESMLERIFSKKYLKNSKKFEKDIRSTIVSIIRNFSKIDSNLEDEEVLNAIGIEKTDNDLYIKGNMKIKIKGEIINLGKFIYGIGLNKETLRNLEIIECSATKIISIENKANFIMEAKSSNSNDLIIFSSGFYSPAQKKFLLKINEFIKGREDIEYYHSGDFDFNGFNIYVYIKNNIFENLKPYKMNKELFIQNIKYAEDINEKGYKSDYRGKLEKLLTEKQYEEFHDIIKEILKTNKVLEQEALLFD